MDHADVATTTTNQPLQESGVLVADVPTTASTVPAERALDLVPCLVVNDSFMFAVVNLSAVLHLADVDKIRQKVVEAVLRDRLASRLPAVTRRPRLHPP